MTPVLTACYLCWGIPDAASLEFHSKNIFFYQFSLAEVQLSEIPCVASGPCPAKAELAPLWCGSTIVSIGAVGLFSPGLLCTPDALVDGDVKTTCRSVSQRELEWLCGITSANGKCY